MFPVFLGAQVTAVTATITDSDSQVWTNGRWTVTFVPNPNYPNINSYNINGVQLNSATYNNYLNQSGVTNGSGALGVNLLDNTLIAPTGTTWKFTITPNASVPATVYPNVAVSTGSMNLTSFLSTNATPIRFPAGGYGSYGYQDSEISVLPLQGGFYWNVTDAHQHLWSGSAWVINSQSGTITGFCALTGCTYTGTILGPTATFTNYTGGSINISGAVNAAGYNIGGIPISAANLSNGVSGTGRVCLASGSACSPTSAITSLQLTSNATQVTWNPSTICNTSTCAYQIQFNLTGSESKLVTAAGAGTSGQYATWNSSGGLGSTALPTIPTVQALKITSGICTTGASAFSSCHWTQSWPSNWGTTNYAVTCTSGNGQGTNAVLLGLNIENRTDTTFDIYLQNADASGAGATTVNEVNCIGVLLPGNA